jgi:aquaporin Z
MGPISGAAFNPAVTVGVLMFGVIAPVDIWAYLVPQLLAGAFAGTLFNVLDLGNDKATTATLGDQTELRAQAEPAP